MKRSLLTTISFRNMLNLTNSAFDPSEFPSLGQNSAPNPSLSARPNYGNDNANDITKCSSVHDVACCFQLAW